jgi:hypothetical protein
MYLRVRLQPPPPHTPTQSAISVTNSGKPTGWNIRYARTDIKNILLDYVTRKSLTLWFYTLRQRVISHVGNDVSKVHSTSIVSVCEDRFTTNNAYICINKSTVYYRSQNSNWFKRLRLLGASVKPLHRFLHNLAVGCVAETLQKHTPYTSVRPHWQGRQLPRNSSKISCSFTD